MTRHSASTSNKLITFSIQLQKQLHMAQNGKCISRFSKTLSYYLPFYAYYLPLILFTLLRKSINAAPPEKKIVKNPGIKKNIV